MTQYFSTITKNSYNTKKKRYFFLYQLFQKTLTSKKKQLPPSLKTVNFQKKEVCLRKTFYSKETITTLPKSYIPKKE